MAANQTKNPLSPAPQATRPMLSVERLGKFEASWTFPDQKGNPYDPDENDVEVVFHGPSGGDVRTPAFWDGDRWKVRYAPLLVGRYTLSVIWNGKPSNPADLTTATFRCIASSGPGFVRRDGARFLFDGETPVRGYYPMGINQAWTEKETPDYPGMFGLMKQNNLNWARVWMCFWDNKALDWAADRTNNPKRGEFFLPAARRWDMIMDSAAKDGIYVQMCLQHHGQYTNGPDANWKDNPANVANGGYLQHPEDFFTDPQARKLTRAKYRYIVARWGYSSHLMAYELFNEVQNITEARPHFDRVVSWHREMAAYIRSIDVNHHLVTTSNSDPGSPLSQIGLDIDQIHAYQHNILGYFGARQELEAGAKPVVVAEFGPDGSDYGYGGLNELFAHDGLWASLMAPGAGAGGMWYWEQLSKKGWWPLFDSAGSFTRDATLSDLYPARPLNAMATGGAADLPITPPLGWAKTTAFNVELGRDGGSAGLNGVSAFIQGTNHRDMTERPIVFHVQGPVEFRMVIGTVAKAGSDPQVSLDGQIVKELHYPAGDADRDVNEPVAIHIPVGSHAISLFNTGFDWYSVKSITLPAYAPALGVLAKGNDHGAVFWAYDRDRSRTEPIAGGFTLTGLKDGAYDVHLWDTWKGTLIDAPMTARAEGGKLKVTLPEVTRDLAGWVRMKD